MQTGDRLYVFDNIKGILIYLVVFAHLLECAGLTGCFAYRLIYVFHMPMFLFVSGFFARFSPKKILTDLVWPYVLFQVVFLLFDGFVINPGTFRLQFTKPYWILWYLFVLIIYTLLTGIIKPKKPVIQITAVAVFTVLALLAGYAGRIGYEFSASRLIVFSPFFFSGFFPIEPSVGVSSSSDCFPLKPPPMDSSSSIHPPFVEISLFPSFTGLFPFRLSPIVGSSVFRSVLPTIVGSSVFRSVLPPIVDSSVLGSENSIPESALLRSSSISPAD